MQRAAHALVIAVAVELRAEYARARHAAEHAQIEHEQKLIDDGHAAHGLCAHLPHHDVVQHGHEIRDAVLDHDGHGHAQYHGVKRLIADILPNELLQVHWLIISFLIVLHM